MRYAPPVAKLALAFAVGVSWVLSGAPAWLAPLCATGYLLLPIGASRGPTAWILLATAGVGALSAQLQAGPEGCERARSTDAIELRGWFLGTPVAGAGAFLPADGCGAVTAVGGSIQTKPGEPVVLEGRWRGGTRPWFRIEALRAAPEDTLREGSAGRALARWRGALVERIEGLYGVQAPLVSALTLARSEGFDPTLREDFARAGLAHLLSISGFHVAVLAGMIGVLLRGLGIARRSAGIGAAAVTWGYVALIGLPDPACRAAIIFSCIALSRVAGRPPARWGALGTAFLVLLVVDPGKIANAGFQLSFAGAAGLVGGSGPLARVLGRGVGRRVPRGLVDGLSAGVAATLATTPIVAWHFERVAVLGIPATLLAAPLVTLALPGAIISVAVGAVSDAAGTFLAGGVSLLLTLLEWVSTTVAGWPWASVWTTRTAVVAALSGGIVGLLLARVRGATPRLRALSLTTWASAALVGWPVLLQLEGRGTVELVVLDVGQGDALALRSPRGRWILVDAGPPSRATDPGAHPVSAALRARGIARLETVILTHPDLDHIGGAEAVLRSFEVGAIYDPALPAGKDPYVHLLALASARGVPWLSARAGGLIELDGMELSIVHPSEDWLLEERDANSSSVVIHLRYGAFDALLTGDADRAAERSFLPRLDEGVTNRTDPDWEVLKVGHHGSDTSTDSLLLAHLDPEQALISAGRDNRYGHPSPAVLLRLAGAGVRVRRTDLEGTLTVRARRDGSYVMR